MTIDNSLYHIYTLGDQLVHFDVDKSTWTIDEISDMADTMKSFVYDADIEEFKRLGRYDILEKMKHDAKLRKG